MVRTDRVSAHCWENPPHRRDRHVRRASVQHSAAHSLFRSGGRSSRDLGHGLRNPWRFSFDRGTGDLWIGDVGSGTYEEVDFQSAGSQGGENYGQNLMEGNECQERDWL